MAQTIIVRLTDDLDEGDADETVSFALGEMSYEIDLSSKNAERLREAFSPFIEKARKSRDGSSSKARGSSTSAKASSKTLYSRLEGEERERFRTWAKLPTARRISDTRVQEWIDAERP
jgi:hypothetical protein